LIRLLCAPTPTSMGVAILLHELDVPFVAEPVDLTRGAAADPRVRALNPDGKVPVLTDPDGEDGTPITLSESGASLLYLAAKHGSPLLPPRRVHRAPMIQWLMWTVSALQPTCGALFRARFMRPDAGEAERAADELSCLLLVLEGRLSGSPHLAGPDLSLADIIAFPWIAAAAPALGAASGPATLRWRDALGTRPAFARGMTIAREQQAREQQERAA
jgi:GST-like protein